MAASGLVMSPAEAFLPALHRGAMPSVEAIQIYLATLGSETTTPMQVFRSDTISSVKMKIQAYKGFYTRQQRLVYGVRELTRNDRLVRDYGVSNGEKLHLVLYLDDIVDVTIKSADGTEYVYKVERSHCVRDLKKQISEKEGLALNAQQLVLRGQNLEDQKCIDELCLEDDAVVHLVLRRSSKVRTRVVGKDVELSVSADEPVLSKGKALLQEVQEVPLTDQSKYTIPHRQLSYNFKNGGTTKNAVQPVYVLEPACGILRYEIPDVLVDILEQAKAGLQGGYAPALASEGSGGAYFLKNSYGVESVAIFKPVDEEPLAINNPRGFAKISRVSSSEGLKRGTRVGEGAMREVVAYLLDHPKEGRRTSFKKHPLGFAGVPPTMLVRCAHEAFRYSDDTLDVVKKPKLGSLQQFVRSFTSCEDMGTAKFDVEDVHKIAVLDMRLANTDRNGGNILVCRDENNDMKLVPIDHGYCLPEKFEDVTFEWIYWSQAEEPFSPSTLKYIESLDAEEDLALLQKHGWSLRTLCKRVFRLSTMLLKKGAAAGLTPYHIGSMMCRETLFKMSTMEEMIEEVEKNLHPSASECDFLNAMSETMDSRINNLKREIR
ncbi:phosphatidylinositol 4-kinase gamma 4 [Physcomitrium patens]|uniref:1-phosphatidylinositol 4-kinase n=1 Tax=Physcomitrium patens TaxID=3218 RepID=A0A2K1JDE9_PHYPA|nr:phosphatidylinositol 4-kinase gamma 4-like [Physcomitrium patens]PNR39549.1 hypothetical protein PHYPA_019827 [Physcomitrium patens]|eukprot:XP_024396247.1 phosphatidylinositol 4-kinase gamma 4-like [Physcomitrella patens]